MSTDLIQLGPETADDWWEIEALYDLTFAPGRSALSSYRLREGVAPLADLCLTARDPAGIIAGAVRNWPVRVGGKPAVLLGPIAVHPTRQGEGIAAPVPLEHAEIAEVLADMRALRAEILGASEKLARLEKQLTRSLRAL